MRICSERRVDLINRICPIHAKMVECGACLEEYQEGELELHRKTCVVRLVFRCVICSRDYVSKEGLWNHLDLHEIADDSKEIHSQESKAKHKRHQCSLCNDHRVYEESSYWNHVHDVHDGFCSRCSECGVNFKSEKLKNDHFFSQCKTRKQTATFPDENICVILPIKSEPMTSHYLDFKEQSNESKEKTELPLPNMSSPLLNEYSCVNMKIANDTDIDMPEKKTEVCSTIETEEKGLSSPLLPIACDICGITFSSNHTAYYHKKTKHGQMDKCPHCRRLFPTEDYQTHLSQCEQNRISCKVCDSTFHLQRNLSRHMRRIHHVRKPQKEKPPAIDQTFACDICGQIFTSYHNAQYHKRKDHGRNHKCPHCRSLFQIEEYQAHLTSCETKERVSCGLCNSKYRNSVYLARHMKRVHRGKGTLNNKSHDQVQMPENSVVGSNTSSNGEIVDSSLDKYSPTNSNDAFDTDSNMDEKNIAVQQLIEDSSRKPSKIKCPHCDGEYGRGKSLINHVRSIHKPSKCNICGIVIHGMEKARYHKVMKHTEPMFECGNCSKKFHWKKDFKFHSSICDPIQTDRTSHKQQQESSQTEEIDLNMDIKVEETTLVAHDDSGQTSEYLSTNLWFGGKSRDEEVEGKNSSVKIKEEHLEEEEENS